MKKTLTIFTLLLALAAPLHAQVFIMEDDGDLNPRDPNGGIVFNVMVPSEDVSNDQYIPLGNGLLLLSGLGGAYLLGKKRREEALGLFSNKKIRQSTNPA